MQRVRNQNTGTTRTESQERPVLLGDQGNVQVLRLRGEAQESEAPTQQRRRITWAEDVVDNEGQGRKSSKVCCIFHKARPVGESSSESESESDDPDSSSDESDSGSGARKAGSGHRHEDGNSSHDHSCKGKGHKQRRAKRKFVPNAYERMPSNRTGNNSSQPS